MSNQQSEEKIVQFLTERPARDRVFYANAINFAFNEEQEAIFDFKLVMPEDLRIAKERPAQEKKGVIEGKRVALDLREVPVELRVYMPVNQFISFVQRMALLWEKLKEEEEEETRAEDSDPVGTEEE